MRNYNCFVMMQFSGENQNAIFKKIEESVERLNKTSDSQYSIRVERADLSKPLSIISLEDHLKNHIDNCDFAIAEISQLNPNVMFELGYAVGIDKPVIILVQKGVKVPADFSGRLYFEYQIEQLDLVPQRLKSFIEGAIDKTIAQEQRSIYFARAYENRSLSDLETQFRNASRHIDLLTTNLTSFVNFGLLHITKERLEGIPEMRVRILTLDPESEFASKRAKQMGASTRTFREELKNSLEQSSRILNAFPDRCRIATYDEFPTQITYMIDEHIYTNTISANQYARNNIVFKLRSTNAGVAKSIIGHFDTVWGRSSVFHRINT
jgi:hypothetical protein